MEIASNMKKTAESIVAAHDARAVALGSLVDGVHDTLDRLASDRKELSKEQGASLAGFASGLARDVGHMLSGFQDGRAAMAGELTKSLRQYNRGIETEVAGLLKGFAQARLRTGRELRRDLQELKADLKDHAAGVAARTRKLRDRLQHEQGLVATDVKTAHTAWRDLTETMAARRQEVEVAEPEAEPRVFEPAGPEGPTEAGLKAPVAKHRRPRRRHKK